MQAAEKKAMKDAHRYVLYDPINDIMIRAENSRHFVVPLEVVNQGDVAIKEWCKKHPKKR